MSETNGKTGGKGNRKGGPGATDKRTFATEAEARQAGRLEGCGNGWKVWKVAGPDGGGRFLWANGAGMATVRGAKAAGFTATCLDAKPVSKDALAAGLAALSDEDRAILIARYVPAPTAAPAQTEAKPSGPATKRGK